MSVSVLAHGRFLIASVPPDATDEQLAGLRDALADAIETRAARGVVVDVSAIDVLDSFATRILETLSQIARLRGAATVIVGIQPDVALSMVQLGLTLEAAETALDLEDGLERLRAAVSHSFPGSESDDREDVR